MIFDFRRFLCKNFFLSIGLVCCYQGIFYSRPVKNNRTDNARFNLGILKINWLNVNYNVENHSMKM